MSLVDAFVYDFALSPSFAGQNPMHEMADILPYFP